MPRTPREEDIGTVLKNNNIFYTIKKENGRIGLNIQIKDINKIDTEKLFEAVKSNFKLFLYE